MTRAGQVSPWRFLSSLDGSREIDCKLIASTRHDELEILTHMIAASKVSILYAFSGNGKSSLLSAGVIPFFVDKGYAAFRTRPRPAWSPDNPVIAFEECMLRELWLPAAQSDADKLLQSAAEEMAELPEGSVSSTRTLLLRLEAQLARLSATPETRAADLRAFLRPFIGLPLRDFIAHAQRFLGPESRLLFVCDQFEELFVHFYDSPDLKEFVAEVAAIAKSDAVRAQFLFSMREDWVGSVIEFRAAIPDIFSSYYKLLPLRMSRARDALTLPAAEAGVAIDGELTTRVLTNLAESYLGQHHEHSSAARLHKSPEHDPFIELPALQVVAEALWRSRDEVAKPFSLSHYEALRTIRAWQQEAAAAT